MEKTRFFDIPEEVTEKAAGCLRSIHPSLKLELVIRKSNHPEDSHLYLVLSSRGHENRYTLHTYNASTGSLNGGCYDISLKKALNVLSERIWICDEEP